MRDEDKPFICYRQGKWSMKIVPRNGDGWRALLLWVLLLMLLCGGFTWLVVSDPENEVLVGWATAGLLVVSGIWALVMIRWMLARSEVIDVDDLLALKREQDRTRKKRS